jgi:hypothetical protein
MNALKREINPMNACEEYQANAAECQRMARVTRNAKERQTWLEMAAAWLRKANHQQRQTLHQSHRPGRSATVASSLGS